MSEATSAIALDAVCCCGCGLSGGEFAVPPPVGCWATSAVLNARKAKKARNRVRRGLTPVGKGAVPVLQHRQPVSIWIKFNLLVSLDPFSNPLGFLIIQPSNALVV